MDNISNRIKILIADDEASVRKLLSLSLSDRNYKCTAVPDGSRALIEMESSKFDIALLDINMPEMAGYEFTSTCRKNLYRMPIFLFSANNYVNIKKKVKECGANGLLGKPIIIDELRTVTKIFVSQ